MVEKVDVLFNRLERREYRFVLIDPYYLKEEDVCLILEALTENGTQILAYSSAYNVRCGEIVTTYETIHDLKEFLMSHGEKKEDG